jgi:DNA-directed RNA polymerase specialized sigma24 family protein
MTASDLLHSLDPWLRVRCRRAAASRPGVSADDLYQESVEEFLRELGRWLQQDPTVSVLAQARSLLGYCLRHAVTRHMRERARRADLHDEEDGEAPLERLPDPRPCQDRVATSEILALAREATTPPCALCLLSLRLPAVVEPADAARARAWKKGGANAVPRPLDEAWGIYEDGRQDLALVCDDVAWKDHVGVAWYTEGPPPELGAEARRNAASKVERYANRGVEDLRAALLAGGAA